MRLTWVTTAILMVSINAVWGADQTGKSLFEKRCGTCHKLPDLAAPPTEGWTERLDKMAPLARLKSGQKQDVLAYLLAHTVTAAGSAALEEDRLFFEGKCSRCHSLDRIFLMPLTDESRRHVVNRMQQQSGTGWLSDEDAERVLNYLAATRFPETDRPQALDRNASAEDIFIARCSACHTLERVFTQLTKNNADGIDSWAHVVSRMRGKAPQWMTDVEARKIVSWLNNIQ